MRRRGKAPRFTRVLWFIMVAILALLMAACSDNPRAGRSQTTDPTPVTEREFVLQQGYQVDTLRVHVNKIMLRQDHVVLDLTLTNESTDDLRVFLGGCGPSQGVIHTADTWMNVYYAGASSDKLALLPAGAARTGLVMLRARPGDAVLPGEVVKLDLHPGYIITPAGGLERLAIPVLVQP